jgi:tRNA A-37 threonylcarbamoyl transferase component Bud32
MVCRRCNRSFPSAPPGARCPCCGQDLEASPEEPGAEGQRKPAGAAEAIGPARLPAGEGSFRIEIPPPSPVPERGRSGSAPPAAPSGAARVHAPTPVIAAGASGLAPPSSVAPRPGSQSKKPEGARIVTPPEGLPGSIPPQPPRSHPGAAPRGPASPSDAAGPRPNLEESTILENRIEGSWTAGSRIAGKYEIISTLGSGGFGTVFKVRHIYRKKYYALKTPHSHFLRDDVFRRRFEREIEAMERFVHPDAVMIRDCGVTEGGIPYYTMDFIDGESLKAVIVRERRLEPERAVEIIRRVLLVLEAAHEHQIIHRDIKPDNILLTQAGGREHVKVLDFGVAKLLDLVGWTSITRDARVGTPRYMSPEQITGDPIDVRADLFSLGIVFYEMVTGEHPFARENDPIRVTAAILSKVPTPAREIIQGLPRHISERIGWMLEKKPKRRPASARAMLDALPSIEDGEQSWHGVDLGTLDVYPSAPRAGAAAVVLRMESGQGERRAFLLFRERVSFGRSGECDLILRSLPCRSQELDPENWRRNLTISSRAGTIRPDGSVLVIDPDPECRGGIAIGGVKSIRQVRIGSDRFHLSVGERALEIDGRRRLRRADRAPLDLSFLARRRPAGAIAGLEIGYGQPNCAIDHVHLRRANNLSLHEYFLVYRQLLLGSAGDAGLHIEGGGVEGEHAVILFEGGESFIAPVEGGVKIGRAGDLGGADREEIDLPAGSLYPLLPGIEIILGAVRIRVDEASPEWYKKP